MLWRILGYFRPHKLPIAAAAAWAVIAAATTAAPIALVRVMVDGVLGGNAQPDLLRIASYGIPVSPESLSNPVVLLKLCALAIVGLYLLNAAAQYFQVVILRAVGLRVVQALRSQIFEKYQMLSMDFMNARATGDLMSRMINDVQIVQGTVNNLVDMAREPIVLVAVVAIAVWMNPALALAALIGLPAIAYAIRALSKAMRRYSRKTQGHLGDLTSVLQESLTGALVVRAFNLEQHEISRFERAHEHVLAQSLKGAKASAAAGPVVIVIGAIGAALVLWLGGNQVIAGEVSAGAMLTFIVAAIAAYDPIRKLSRTHNQFQQVFAAAERIFEILDTKPSVVDSGRAIAPSAVKELSFEDVHFAYNADEPVLRGVSFRAEHGQTIAIVGESGAGKTTLLHLIPRFQDPTSGAIRINGRSVSEFSLEALRGMMAIVTQDTFLFDESVTQNIRHGRPTASDDEVKDAARAAYADAFIRELPEGYETRLGERGVRLSGGQRQRIAIARALLKDAPILLLDEATSSLDSESEDEVQRALDRLMSNRTTLVIAHRLSTIQNASAIVVLSRGRVAEYGAHKDLIGASGEYQRLYDLQYRLTPRQTARP